MCIGNWLCLQLLYTLAPPSVHSKHYANNTRPAMRTPLPLADLSIGFARGPGAYQAQEVTLPNVKSDVPMVIFRASGLSQLNLQRTKMRS
jgi:hypothetical protein